MEITAALLFISTGLLQVFGQNNTSRQGRKLPVTDSHFTPCAEHEGCTVKRLNPCISEPNSYISCGETEFQEKYYNCVTCQSPGYWVLQSDTTCVGDGCYRRKETTYKCSNALVNANCIKITTKYCDQSKICDGSWSSWTDFTACFNISNHLKRKIIKKNCLKNGSPSYACRRGSTPLSEQVIAPCSATTTTSTSTTTTTTTTSATKPAGKPEGRDTNVVITTSKPSGEKRTAVFHWWSDKSYIFVIQSVIILILLAVIFYLLCYKFKKRRKDPKFPIVKVESSIGESFVTFRSQRASKHSASVEALAEPEYACMLPKHRLSLPSMDRPLPERPNTFRPEKPPRRNRASTNPATLPEFPPQRSNSVFLTTPKSVLRTHSVPSSPNRATRQEQSRTFYNSMDRLNQTYLAPVN